MDATTGGAADRVTAADQADAAFRPVDGATEAAMAAAATGTAAMGIAAVARVM